MQQNISTFFIVRNKQKQNTSVKGSSALIHLCPEKKDEYEKNKSAVSISKVKYRNNPQSAVFSA